MSYDYIIVGAGASGTVVASRLCAAECASKLHILLLEVGSDNRTKNMSVDMAAQNPMKLWGRYTFDDCLVARSSKQVQGRTPSARWWR